MEHEANQQRHPAKALGIEGRVALVTGSSRGIGRAIALALADAGASVVLHGRSASLDLESARAEVAARSPAVVVSGDLSEPLATKRVIDEAARWKERLDILVNNAGAVAPEPASEMSEAIWEEMIAINLKAPFFCSQHVLPYMRKARFGRIVNISSVAAEAAIPAYAHYGAAKAGLNAVTRSLALEWGQYGVTVNAVSPAFIRTDLTEAVFKRLPDFYEDQLARVLVRRMGEPSEVAAAVVYLASEAASYITGETIHVDGGYLIQ